MSQNKSNPLSREIARLLHGEYVEDSKEDKAREQQERNQEYIERQWKHTDIRLFTAYLKDHEHDIAYGVNDFGDLRGVFLLCFGREPACA